MKFREIFLRNKEKKKLEEKFEKFLDETGEILNLYKAGQRAWDKYDMERSETTVTINSKEPIIILPVGDLHIGHVAVDIYELIANWREFLKAENIFLVLMGDYVEWFILSADVFGIFEQILSPDMQMRFFEKMLAVAPERILCAMASRGHQHDAQASSQVGYSIMANTFEKYGIPCLGNMGRLNIKLNGIEYKGALAHHSRFHSYHNRNHSAHQLMTVEFQGVDFAITAHKHTMAMQEQWFGGKLEHTIVCPTYKIKKKDRYSKKFWNSPTFLRHYCLVLYPDKKIDTMRLQVAKQYIQWLDNKEPKDIRLEGDKIKK